MLYAWLTSGLTSRTLRNLLSNGTNNGIVS